MKAFFYTFGCKVNQYETENIKEAMLSEGYEVTEDYADAEVCVVNSCTVTAQSDSKCRQLIHKIKKANPECLIVLAGCFPQAFEKEASALDECGICHSWHRCKKGDTCPYKKVYHKWRAYYQDSSS